MRCCFPVRWLWEDGVHNGFRVTNTKSAHSTTQQVQPAGCSVSGVCLCVGCADTVSQGRGLHRLHKPHTTTHYTAMWRSKTNNCTLLSVLDKTLRPEACVCFLNSDIEIPHYIITAPTMHLQPVRSPEKSQLKLWCSPERWRPTRERLAGLYFSYILYVHDTVYRSINECLQQATNEYFILTQYF